MSIKPEDIPKSLVYEIIRRRGEAQRDYETGTAASVEQEIATCLNAAIEADVVDVSATLLEAREMAEQRAEQQERAKKQMTLGQLIARLTELPGDMQMTNLTEPHSYRGFYCDLAFECREGARPVADVLHMCETCIGSRLSGHKGGNYTIHRDTPVWIAGYMQWPGTRLLQVGDDGSIATAEPYFVENDD